MAMFPTIKSLAEAATRYADCKLAAFIFGQSGHPEFKLACPINSPDSHNAPDSHSTLDSKPDSIVYTSHKDDNGCRKIEDRVKLGPICRRPDYRRKPTPPFMYGYCKEEEEELPLFCPPKKQKKDSRKNQCCKQMDGSKCDE